MSGDRAHPPHLLEDRSASIPIPEWARATALQFAREAPVRARQICLNTLAACAMKEYLQHLGYDTDLAQSQCWRPVARQLLDVADLTIRGKGILECRPIEPGQTICPIPPEATTDRLGYAVLQIDLEDTRRATLLGFSPAPGSAALSIFELAPIDALPEYLETVKRRHQLGQWFEAIFGSEWQAVEALVAPRWRAGLSPIAASRSADAARASPQRRVRAIDFGDGRAVALVLTLQPEGDREIAVTLEACPCQDRPMPTGLRLVLLDDAGMSVMETQASDAGAGLHFSVEPGEQFTLELRLENAIVTEYFAA